MDRVKAQAEQVALKAQEATKAGQAKFENMSSSRHADALLRDLGAIVFSQRTGRAGPEAAGQFDALLAQLQEHEATYGQISTAATAPPPGTAPAGGAPAGGPPASGTSFGSTAPPAAPPSVPEGGFRLD
ncbi:MAG: hypothetical protein ACYDB7_04710 [Mycobacteriales bacterium]